MKTTTVLKIAGSSLVLGLVAVGCTTSRPASLASVAPRAKPAKPIDAAKAEQQAAKRAAEVSGALKARRPDKAIPAAEEMVALSPRNGSYRALLGQAYLLGGRFQSAGQSFQDAVMLDPNNGRAALSLALAQIASGHSDDALAVLDHFRGVIPQADLGLALALAGDRDHAVTLLEAAAKAPDADAKTRQNLALSYALAGRWPEARATAARDVSPAELDLRMLKWSSFANPRAPWDQVAMLLNVTPHADVGQPTRLALAPEAAPSAMAAAEPEPAPAISDAAPVAAEPAPVAVAEAAPPAPMLATSLPLVSSAAADAPRAPRVALQPSQDAAAPALLLRHAARTATPRVSPGGQYVVQLGAFSNASRVEAAWSQVAGRMGLLSGYTPASTTFASRSLTFHRLSIAGFESRDHAVAMCEKVRAAGGSCFVRTRAGDAPMQWASLAPTRLAMR